MMKSVAIVLLVVGTATLQAQQAAAPAASSSRALPDWSGVWAMQGGTVFDRATVQPPNGRVGEPGVREFPPLTDEFEAIYRKNMERVKAGTFADPITVCGTPAGFPRLMNLPDTYEFAV